MRKFNSDHAENSYVFGAFDSRREVRDDAVIEDDEASMKTEKFADFWCKIRIGMATVEARTKIELKSYLNWGKKGAAEYKYTTGKDLLGEYQFIGEIDS